MVSGSSHRPDSLVLIIGMAYGPTLGAAAIIAYLLEVE